MRSLSLLLAFGLLVLPVHAASTPEDTVRAFYACYIQSLKSHPAEWVQTLMKAQKDHVDPQLNAMLTKLASGDPNKNEEFLDFDPFSNSQIGLDTYTVQTATMKDGLAYVPVAMKLSHTEGPEKVMLRMVLRPQGQGWQIANVAYPASSGAPAWDLKNFLKTTLGK